MAVVIVCMLLLVFSAWYVPGRFTKLLGGRRVWPWRAAALLFLAGYVLLLMSAAYASDSPAATGLSNVYGLLFIFYVCVFLLLGAAHLFSPLGKRASGRSIAALVLVLSAAYVGLGFIQAQSFTLTRYELPLQGLPAPVKIAHISDLHLGAQRREGYLKKVIEAVNREKPDLVIFNGDLVDGNIALKPELFALFGDLAGDKYFTTGNHEFYIDTDRALRLIADSGLKILRNRMVETHGLQLIGLEYMNTDQTAYDSHRVNDLTIEEELPKIGRDRSRPTLLLHHSPMGLRYAAAGGIDLMLAGHTHGGQVFPGTTLAAFMFPLVKGLYRLEGTTVLVSQGAGTFGPWMRLGTFNEIQIINLIPAQ